MKKTVCLILCTCILFAVAGCSQESGATTTPTVHKVTVPAETTTPTNPTTATAPTEESSADYESPLAAISLPLILQEKTSNDGKVIARYSHQDVSITLPDADVAQIITLDMLNRIDQTAETAISIFEDAQSDYSGQADWYPYSYSINYEVSRLDENILSLSGIESVYDRNPRSVQNAISLTYDLTTGEVLVLRTIFHEENFADALCEMIINGLKDRSEELYADYENIIKSVFNTNVPIENWYFSNEGLCFYFSPYEIAPYSAGTVVSTIPYENLSGLLKDAYFPSEQLAYRGAVLVSPLRNDGIPEGLTQFAELKLDSSGERFILTSDGSISNIRIFQKNHDSNSFESEGMVFAMAGMGPSDAIILELSKNNANETISISFDSYGSTQTLHLTQDSDSTWLFTK